MPPTACSDERAVEVSAKLGLGTAEEPDVGDLKKIFQEKLVV